MTDESKTKTLVEELTVAEVGPGTSELSPDTTTVIAPAAVAGGDQTEASPDPNGSGGTDERQTKAFDPYRFQRMTVPPGLRSEMAQAKLPRLAHEYFKETLPPATMKVASNVDAEADADPDAPPEVPKARSGSPKAPSDAPTVFEPSEPTPTSLALPMSSTPRTILWGGLGLLVGVILLFIAHELTKDEPKLAIPPEKPPTAQARIAASEPIMQAEAREPGRSGRPAIESALLPSPVPPPSPASSSNTPSPDAMTSSTAASTQRSGPRKPSEPASTSSHGQSPAPNTKRLWITPR
jgi:hypothetical protein